MNFFESLIQANVRKEAENIPSAAIKFWTEKHVKKPFEEEIKKILWSDLSSKIEGYEAQKLKDMNLELFLWC